MTQNNPKGSGFLKVTGILLIIFGAIALILSIISLLGVSVLLSAAKEAVGAEEVNLGVSSFMLYVGSIFLLISSAAELKECMAETEDRFGSIPDPVYCLFLVIRLKLLAETLGVRSVVQKKGGFRLEFDGLNNLNGDDLSALFKEFGRHFEFSMGSHLEMHVRTGKLSEIKALLYVIKVMAFLVKRRPNGE